MLLRRKYKPKVIDAAFQRAKALTRVDTLKKVNKIQQEKTVFVTTYDPRLPCMGPLLQKHYKTLTKDPQMREIFKHGIVVAHKRYRNIQEFLFRARLYDTNPRMTRPIREAKLGWRICNNCIACCHFRK